MGKNLVRSHARQGQAGVVLGATDSNPEPVALFISLYRRGMDARMDDLWNSAFADMNLIDSDDEAKLSLSIDQRLKLAEVKALLGIERELFLIQSHGINPDWTERPLRW